MKNMIKFAGVAAVAFALAQSLQAVPITGTIGFSGDVVLNNTSAGNSTAVTSFINPVVVGGDSGSFASIVLPASAIFTSSTWYFNTPPNPAPSFLWMVGGFTFVLTSSSISTQGYDASGGYVTADGTGTVSGNGYTPTTLTWHFSTQDPSTIYNGTTVWTFSASDRSIPDGGATVMLLGIALSGVALLKKKLTA